MAGYWLPCLSAPPLSARVRLLGTKRQSRRVRLRALQAAMRANPIGHQPGRKGRSRVISGVLDFFGEPNAGKYRASLAHQCKRDQTEPRRSASTSLWVRCICDYAFPGPYRKPVVGQTFPRSGSLRQGSSGCWERAARSVLVVSRARHARSIRGAARHEASLDSTSWRLAQCLRWWRVACIDVVAG